MIVSASYRTDIPAFYAEWFRRRLDAGQAQTVNPYNGRTSTLDLTPAGCAGFVFWTRNIRPLWPVLRTLAVAVAARPFVVQYTITGYPRSLEASVVAPDRAVADIRALAEAFGPACVVWRYDPVLWSDATPPDAHRARFADLADSLRGAVDEVVLSAATIYAKTRRNLNSAAARHGFTWWDPPQEAKAALLADLGAMAAARGMTPTLCAQPDLLAAASSQRPGHALRAARCIDAARLSRVAGQPIQATAKGNRPGCHCAAARDLGAYDTCPHGCMYCYAVRRPDLAKQRYARHDPGAPGLVPPTSVPPDSASKA